MVVCTTEFFLLEISICREISLDVKSKSERTVQVMKSSFNSIDIINVYRSAEGSKTTLIESMRQMIDEGRTTVIAGDFNIDYLKNPNDIVIKTIISCGFQQIVSSQTHEKGRLLDHIYIPLQGIQ